MARETSGFFDSIGDDRVYQADGFARRFRLVLTDGVLNGGDNLRVTAPGTGMLVEVGYGLGMVQGYDYYLEDDGEGRLTLEIDEADVQPRIDRVVLRLDHSLERRAIYADVIKGMPGVYPEPPELSREGNVYEVSLAQVLVRGGTTEVSSGDITDERHVTDVCGYMSSLISVPVEELHQQYVDLEDDLRGRLSQWITSLGEVLEENAATNLYGMVEDHKTDYVVPHQYDDEGDDTDWVGVRYRLVMIDGELFMEVTDA